MVRPRPSEGRREGGRRAREMPGVAWRRFWEVVAKFLADSPFEMAAALSFYTVLSLSPLVLIVVSCTSTRAIRPWTTMNWMPRVLSPWNRT